MSKAKIIFYAFAAMAAAANGIADGVRWFSGDMPSPFTWIFAIMFSIDVFIDCLSNIEKA